jgi:RNA polymerase sigma-70 factor (ECF subfamily)
MNQAHEELRPYLFSIAYRMSPVERAVFLLREVFDHPYEKVAEVVGETPENCRQSLARARRHVEDGKSRSDVPR